jgi:translation initiation factor 1 (eIF-1/SUI1)
MSGTDQQPKPQPVAVKHTTVTPEQAVAELNDVIKNTSDPYFKKLYEQGKKEVIKAGTVTTDEATIQLDGDAPDKVKANLSTTSKGMTYGTLKVGKVDVTTSSDAAGVHNVQIKGAQGGKPLIIDSKAVVDATNEALKACLLTGNFTPEEARAFQTAVKLEEKFAKDGFTEIETQQIVTALKAATKEGQRGL